MAIQPIRLFGDPVLRSPRGEFATFDKELRRLVADLTDTMLDAPGAGLAAPQIGVGLRAVHLERRRRGRPPGQPVARPVRGAAGGPRGLPVPAGLTYECRRALSVVATGFDMHGEPVRIEGSWLLAGRSSTRPTISTASSSSTSSTGRPARGVRWTSVSPTGSALRSPGGAALPARHPRPRPLERCASSSRVPPRWPSRRSTLSPAAGHELVGVVLTFDAPAGRGRKLVLPPVAERADALGVPS